jgi:ABC-2 type transport system permease protein
MRKIWLIALKDTRIRFRDRSAILLMLIAPLILSAIIGSAFGDLISNTGAIPFSDIPVVIVNDDRGQISQRLIDVLQTGVPADLIDSTMMEDLETARQMIVVNDVRAVIYIPDGFSDSVELINAPSSSIHLYTDPTATITPSIVRSLVTQIANGFSSVGISARVSISQIQGWTGELGTNLESVAIILNEEIEANVSAEEGNVTTALTSTDLNKISVSNDEDQLTITNPLAFFAPSMGILFLMLIAMGSARSILDEETAGTLDRLISMPISNIQILLGKIGGTFLTGVLQFTIFVFASRVIFNLSWGNSAIGLIVMTLAIVAAFTSLGAIIAAFARDAVQAASLGGVIVLASSALGGNFFPVENYPDWLGFLSKLTINRWAIDGLVNLTVRGGDLPDIALEAGVLLVMAIILFVLAMWQFHRRILR